MKKKKIAKNILAHITLTILAVIWVMPLIWIILTSFRAQKGAYTSSFFPKAYTLDNYTKLFTDTGILNFPRMFENTLIVALVKKGSALSIQPRFLNTTFTIPS